MQNPIDVFSALWSDARTRGTAEHHNAVCVSTVDGDGYPNARFVDLKDADERGFVFCTSLESTKALEIARSPRAAMTMWWEHVATQVRIRGVCQALPAEEADTHWASRSRDAQLATLAFTQSRTLPTLDQLAEPYANAELASRGSEIGRPATWGGFRLRPDRIEFLEFRRDRIHIRRLYELAGSAWRLRLLQP